MVINATGTNLHMHQVMKRKFGEMVLLNKAHTAACPTITIKLVLKSVTVITNNPKVSTGGGSDCISTESKICCWHKRVKTPPPSLKVLTHWTSALYQTVMNK
jgi:hypothetical protein